jgi:hypothetical protein
VRAATILLISVTASTAADPQHTPSVGDRYFMALFGGQGDILRPRTAHTWATFIHVSCTQGNEQIVAADTISWLPATLRVRPLARDAELGVNLTLGQTLSHTAGGPRSRVAVFGPFEISFDTYRKALAQMTLLESGAIRYHSLGLHGRRADVMHCVDAVTRMDTGWEAAASPSRWYGQAGTGQMARAAVACGIVHDSTAKHSWLLREINPDGYRLVPRAIVTQPAAHR